MSLHPFTKAMETEALRQARRHRATIDITPIGEPGGLVLIEAYAPQGQLWNHNHRPCIDLKDMQTGALYSLLIQAMAKGTYVAAQL